MTLVAIDTSVLIGLVDARDVWHPLSHYGRFA